MVTHQFIMGMVPLLLQAGNKCRLHNGRFTICFDKFRCRVFRMKTTWMCSLCHMQDLDDEHWHLNAKSRREFFQEHIHDTYYDQKLNCN